MAVVISISNLKGGVGKTTISINLAGFLSKSFKVFLVDSDPQGSISGWLQRRNKNDPNKLKHQNLEVAENPYSFEDLKILRQKTKNYDYIIIDCPPEDDKIMRTALSISHYTIIPVKPSPFDIYSSEKTILTKKEGLKTKAIDVKPFFLISLLKVGTLLARDIRGILKVFNIPIFKTEIADRIALTEAGIYGKTIFEYLPSHQSVEEFTKLGKEVLKWQKRV